MVKTWLEADNQSASFQDSYTRICMQHRLQVSFNSITQDYQARNTSRVQHILLSNINKSHTRAVVGAQLVEQSLPTPEVRSSNPDIIRNYIEHLFCVNWKDEIKKKRPGMAHFYINNKSHNTFCWGLKFETSSRDRFPRSIFGSILLSKK